MAQRTAFQKFINRTTIICMTVMILTFLSCEKFFHPEETSIGKLESYDEWVSATEGVYGKLGQAFNSADYGEDNLWADARGFYAVNVQGDDLSYKNPSFFAYYYDEEDDCRYRGLYNFNDFYNRFVHDSWKTLYQTVVSANNVVIQYNKRTTDDPAIDQLAGEAHLIRAYCHFRLTRTYGRIPLIKDIEIDYHLPKPSFENIYECIEQDLKKAMKLLPNNSSTARIPYVTPHRGTAKALLAEVYLSWAGYPVNDAAKYDKAAREAGEVIDSATYFGFGLMDDFAHLWDKEHRYNKESLFTLYFADPIYSTDYQEPNLVYLGFKSDESSLSWNIMPDSETRLTILFFAAEINFYNQYPPGYRKEITFFTEIYIPNIHPYYPAIDTGYISVGTISPCSRNGYRKFYFEGTETPYEQFDSDSTYGRDKSYYFGNQKAYLFRYAHTLLTYAEAAARSGQLDQQAYESINRIRRRANKVDLNSPSAYDLQPGLSPEVFADSVVWERAWELCGEPEGRWFDLVRLEMVEELPELRHPEEGGPPAYPITKEDYFYPAPGLDRDLNPHLET